MNERIRGLAEQAGMTDDKFGMFFAKDKHDEDGVDLEKFAELIIQECTNIVNKRKDAAIEASWCVDEAMSNAVWDIEAHFYGDD